MLEFGVVITFVCVTAIVVKLFLLSIRNKQISSDDSTAQLISIDELKKIFKSHFLSRANMVSSKIVKDDCIVSYRHASSLLNEISGNPVAEPNDDDIDTIGIEAEEEHGFKNESTAVVVDIRTGLAK